MLNYIKVKAELVVKAEVKIINMYLKLDCGFFVYIYVLLNYVKVELEATVEVEIEIEVLRQHTFYSRCDFSISTSTMIKGG